MKLIKESANILHSNELASLSSAEEINITANSLPSGFFVTDKVLKYFVKDVAQGAAT
ncbi:hypothetical protein Tco_0376554, partial [Tanacetum coccineum]